MKAGLSVTLAIARRECGSFFRLPVGWVVIALFLLVSAGTFWRVAITPGEIASMRDFFQFTTFLLIVIAPAISMRLFSEEMRTRSLESLMTAPVSDTGLIAGKFLGSVLFLLLMLAPTGVYVVLLFMLADPAPDLGPIVAGYLSLMLVGCLYLAIGTLGSTMTSSQTLAFLGTFMGLLVLLLVPAMAIDHVPSWAAGTLGEISVIRRVDDFGKGVVDLAHVVFFVSGSILFLVLAYLSINSRRWR